MYDDNNIFAKILRNEIPCNKVYEDDNSLFFNDINPIAKIHILGIPKISCINFDDFISKASKETVVVFFENINLVIEKLNIKKDGYRIITNSGKNGGQEVPHFHIHILAGQKINSIG
tara:strand:- start:352 stop:702 length:351 start_codon:yes stop_codon:yes gene_type:complete